MIPTVAQCMALMEQYAMLDNIREHSLVVARVTELLGRGLTAAGRQLDLELLIAGALLHDIAKTLCLNSNESHAARGRAICLAHGFDEIADIVGEHVVLQNGVRAECCCPKEIVYYADKRVKHDQVVGLDERLDYILERYGENSPQRHAAIRANFENSRRIESKLFAVLPWRPDEVGDLVNGGGELLPWSDWLTVPLVSVG